MLKISKGRYFGNTVEVMIGGKITTMTSKEFKKLKEDRFKENHPKKDTPSTKPVKKEEKDVMKNES